MHQTRVGGNQNKMKEILSILFLFLITLRLSSQNIYSYSSGNGYGFEIVKVFFLIEEKGITAGKK
jgi:hypothetical protein